MTKSLAGAGVAATRECGRIGWVAVAPGKGVEIVDGMQRLAGQGKLVALVK